MTAVGGISGAGSYLFPLVDRAGAASAPGPASVLSPGEGQAAGGAPQAGSFGQLLRGALDDLSALEGRADHLTAMLARGEPVELHEVIVATEKAQLALDLAVQLRNRVVEAYQEIMRMPV